MCQVKHQSERCTSFLLFLGALTACLMVSLARPAQAAPIRYLPEQKLWVLQTDHSTYVVGVNEREELQNVYWGERIARDDDFKVTHSRPEHASFDSSETMTNLEYPGWGGMLYTEPCLKVTRADGDRDLVLKYVSHEIRGETLEITTKDIQDDILAKLTYRVYPTADIIRKQAEIRNQTQQSVTVESAQSGVWYMPPGSGNRLSYLSGRWAGETQLNREPIGPGKKVLESRRGNTSHQLNPWFAIDDGERADEEHGRVWFGALGWSGNWKLTIEQTPAQQARVVGGYNDFDFGYLLKPGEALSTPPFYAGFTNQGFGEASRLMHRFEREEILPERSRSRLRPVLYNSWEATLFNVNEAGQKQLAEKAAKIGVELFVMDDGWFGERNDDHAGLGDWVVNPKKFPDGLKPLIGYVNNLGMDFGLWFEPEMVNPNSDLYRKHPDWAMNFPGRPRSEARNQLVLNMARDDVKEYIFNSLDKVLAENNIRFIKWDMNRHFSEPGWPEMPVDEQKKIWVKYVTNVYEIIDRLRAKYPRLEIESCSGGGGRVRSRHSAARRGGLDFRQHRGVRPAGNPGRLQLCLRAQSNDGLGDRRAKPERPLDAAQVPLSGGHARLAGHRLKSQPLVGCGFRTRRKDGGLLQAHPRNRPGGQALPASLPARGKRHSKSVCF